jgi:uncharacterized RDD family membrane protein YckC
MGERDRGPAAEPVARAGEGDRQRTQSVQGPAADRRGSIWAAPPSESLGGDSAPDPVRRPLADEPAPEYLGGYTSAPPPGAYGGAPGPAPAVVPGAWELAGWWSRVAAFVLDGLIIGVGGLLLLALFGALFSVGFFASDEAGVIAVMFGLMLAFAAFAVVALLYAPLMMAKTNGRTLGRMAVGIRVVRANGLPMTFGWAMLREVAVKWLLFGVVGGSVTFGLAWLIDVLWPLWDEENRALHDFLVDTRVVRD